MMQLDRKITDEDFEAALAASLDGLVISDTGLPPEIVELLDGLTDSPPETLIQTIRDRWEQFKRERPEDFTD